MRRTADISRLRRASARASGSWVLGAALGAHVAGEVDQRLPHRILGRARRLVGGGRQLAAARRQLDQFFLERLPPAIDDHVGRDPVRRLGVLQDRQRFELVGLGGLGNGVEVTFVDSDEDAVGFCAAGVDDPALARQHGRRGQDGEESGGEQSIQERAPGGRHGCAHINGT
ncbi:hypothetical protein ACOTH8_03055 [Achromobacter xylosoxidans]